MSNTSNINTSPGLLAALAPHSPASPTSPTPNTQPPTPTVGSGSLGSSTILPSVGQEPIFALSGLLTVKFDSAELKASDQSSSTQIQIQAMIEKAISASKEQDAVNQARKEITSAAKALEQIDASTKTINDATTKSATYHKEVIDTQKLIDALDKNAANYSTELTRLTGLKSAAQKNEDAQTIRLKDANAVLTFALAYVAGTSTAVSSLNARTGGSSNDRVVNDLENKAEEVHRSVEENAAGGEKDTIRKSEALRRQDQILRQTQTTDKPVEKKIAEKISQNIEDPNLRQYYLQLARVSPVASAYNTVLDEVKPHVEDGGKSAIPEVAGRGV